MKKIFLIFSISFCICKSWAQSDIDVLQYKFKIGLNDADDSIKGLAIITVRFLHATSEVKFDLVKQKSDGKGMKVLKTEGNNIRGWSHQDDQLRILLGSQKKVGDTGIYIIHYSGIPADGLIISKTKFGARGFFADNWPDRGHHWIPCHEDPADKAKLEFSVTAPDHYQVVANGIQIEETSLGNGFKTTVWKEDVPVSPKVMVIGVADFAVNLSGFIDGCIPVYSWVYPENKDKGFYDYAQAGGILEYYINHVGPYGYKKLANVQSKTRFGGLENANTIFYSENSVTGTRKSEGLLAHEIAHQWFGNMATEKNFGHLWLSEGFATYFTILYFENKYGKDTATYMLKEDREQTIAYSKRSDKPIVDESEKNYMNLLNANSYQKGGWILHMLRSQLGDSVFWRSIRKYYHTYAGSIAGTEDLQKIFENESGYDLSVFFKQWLYTTGQPELSIKWEFNSQKKETTVTINQLQKGNFIFLLTIGFDYGNGKSEKQKVNIDTKSKTFTFKSLQKPNNVVPDPDTELLMQATISEK